MFQGSVFINDFIYRRLRYLLAHGFRVGNRGAEEAVPLQPAVESGPVIVAVPGVGETPGDQGVKLPVCRVAGGPYNDKHDQRCLHTANVIINKVVNSTSIPAEHAQTPLRAPVLLRPFFLSGCAKRSFLEMVPSLRRTSMLGRSLQSEPGANGM